MSERFSLHPDANWYRRLVARYGDAVPPVEHLQIRRGLRSIAEDLFGKLDDADRFRACLIHGIITRSAGFVVIDARFSTTATEADRRMCNRVVERIQERLCEACEHCGREGEAILKVGLEARLADPDVEPGDRLLCAECFAIAKEISDDP